MFHMLLCWKLYEMNVVSRDNIWPLMWVKVLIYPREFWWRVQTSSISMSSVPHVEKLLMQSGLLQDWFALLNGHGFMNGISIPYLCDIFDVKDCYFVVHPTL